MGEKSKKFVNIQNPFKLKNSNILDLVSRREQEKSNEMGIRNLSIVVVLHLIHHGRSVLLEEGNDDNQGGIVLKMEHSFDNGKTYSNRGSVTIHSLRSGAVSIQQDDLTEAEKDSLEALCDQDS